MTDNKQKRDAFQQFTEFLAQVDRDFLSEERFITEPADIAEGQHMLLHLVKAGLDAWVDNDASRPRFANISNAVLKWGGEGPDNPSHCAPLDPNRRYIIRGRMRDEAYISFTVYTGKAEGDWNDGVISALNHTQFDVDADGYFEIAIAAEEKAGALHMQPGKPNCVVARHYWENETTLLADPQWQVELEIECLDDPGYPRPLSPVTLAEKLEAVKTFIRGQTLDRPLPGTEPPPSWFSQTPNDLPQPERWVPTEGGGAGAIDNAYCAGLTMINPDEALIVEGNWPDCVYANVCFWNRFQQNTDFRYRSGSLNRKQMKTRPDGSWTFVLAHKDPGVENWLDTEGHVIGTLYFRYLMSTGDIGKPVCRVVPFDQLEGELTAADTR